MSLPTDLSAGKWRCLSETSVKRKGYGRRSAELTKRASSFVISLVAVVVVWELLGRYVIKSDLVFAPMSHILLTMYEMARSGELWRHMKASGSAFFAGYTLAVVLGVMLGFVIALKPTLRLYIEPWLVGLYATPMIALAPIFVVLLGIGVYSKIAIIFIEAFFPITVNASLGIRSTDRDLIEAARSFGATDAQVVRTVYLPYSLPFIIAGMRIGVARGLAGVVISEIFGSVAGIGNLIWFSAESYDMPRLFSGVFILAATSLILMSLLGRLERYVAPWRNQS
jgi:ABC-type nitrate/sulfonate/bicarbonate transport system permease component